MNAREALRTGLDVLIAVPVLVALASFRIDLAPDEPFVQVSSWNVWVGHAVILGLIVVLWAGYLQLRRPEQIQQRRLRLFLISLLIIVALLGRGTDVLAPYLVPLSMGPYLVPVALGAGLAAIFAGAEAAFSLTVVLALWVGLGEDPQLIATLAAFGSGAVAVFRCYNLRRLSDLPLAGVEIGLAGTVIHAGAALAIVGPVSMDPIGLLWSGLNGLISALLIFGGLPLAEMITQRTSPLGLVELLNPANPLLQLLREHAPGTYHHSFNVADLAEGAAQAIGADPLLAKVGGYYHDIGKMRRPEFFIENQQADENPHEEISPSMSKMILTSHVKEGEELAREYGLRDDIVRFIRQHHGTSVIRFFYLKALREGKTSEDAISDYRYNTEHPDTPETAIVMLADSVEAASKGLKDGSKLEEFVADVMQGPIDDGQLNDSPLTLRDIERIRTAFVRTLRAMRHDRTGSYPGPSESDPAETSE
ncbi:MAG: HDIG domain-containing metalloprotein [Candidatus Bipolaricaulia bacterium]